MTLILISIRLGLSLEFARKENRNRVEPPAWIRRYLVIPSIDALLGKNKGRKPNKDSSSPIHIKNQLVLLEIIIRPIRLVIRKVNHEGYNFIIADTPMGDLQITNLLLL